MTWLLDAGPLVALFDRGDSWHARMFRVFERFKGRLVLTMPVLTEVMQHLQGSPVAARKCIEFVTGSEILIYPFCESADLRLAGKLMEKYGDVPMDFADASLVVLAGHSRVRDVLTLDERGFRVFRIGTRDAFNLVLDHF
jgi:uncharacterized protein